MNCFKNPANLPIFSGLLGVLGMVLRFWLLKGGFDNKDLVINAYPAGYLTLIVGVLALLVLLLALWGKADTKRAAGMFPASVTAAAVSAAAAVGLGIAGWGRLFEESSFLFRAAGVLGLLSAAAAVLLALCRFKGLRPHFLLRSLITVFLMLNLVCHYQQWFAEPQFTLYAPQLMAHVLLMLACYHRVALEAGVSGRKRDIFTSQLAGFLCLVAVPGSGEALFYLTMGAWMLLDCGVLRLSEKKPAGARTDEEAA